MIIFKIISK